jgi:NTE family protein
MFGATQLMMQSIIASKLAQCRPDILIRPPVSRFRVLDFMKVDAVLAETASVKDEVKRAIETAIEARLVDEKPRPANLPEPNSG